jgi:hypothetical protein
MGCTTSLLLVLFMLFLALIVAQIEERGTCASSESGVTFSLNERRSELSRTVQKLCWPGLGILAADESPSTCGKRVSTSLCSTTEIMFDLGDAVAEHTQKNKEKKAETEEGRNTHCQQELAERHTGENDTSAHDSTSTHPLMAVEC